jgi:hypothetical protein
MFRAGTVMAAIWLAVATASVAQVNDDQTVGQQQGASRMSDIQLGGWESLGVLPGQASGFLVDAKTDGSLRLVSGGALHRLKGTQWRVFSKEIGVYPSGDSVAVGGGRGSDVTLVARFMPSSPQEVAARRPNPFRKPMRFGQYEFSLVGAAGNVIARSSTPLGAWIIEDVSGAESGQPGILLSDSENGARTAFLHVGSKGMRAIDIPGEHPARFVKGPSDLSVAVVKPGSVDVFRLDLATGRATPSASLDLSGSAAELNPEMISQVMAFETMSGTSALALLFSSAPASSEPVLALVEDWTQPEKREPVLAPLPIRGGLAQMSVFPVSGGLVFSYLRASASGQPIAGVLSLDERGRVTDRPLRFGTLPSTSGLHLAAGANDTLLALSWGEDELSVHRSGPVDWTGPTRKN